MNTNETTFNKRQKDTEMYRIMNEKQIGYKTTNDKHCIPFLVTWDRH